MKERRRRLFAETFKREAVERVRTSGLPIVRVAEELGLHETVLRRWIARYGTMASPRRTAPPPPTPSKATAHTAATLDRLLCHAQVAQIQGESERSSRRQAPRRHHRPGPETRGGRLNRPPRAAPRLR